MLLEESSLLTSVLLGEAGVIRGVEFIDICVVR